MLTKTTMTTATTSNTSPTTSSGASFPHDLIESIKLNWNVMTLTIINTVLLFLNLILVCVLIYAVYANSRRVIRFFKNYVRFYSQVLSPPAYLESALGPLEEAGKTASTSSSQTNTSYSTSDEINPNNNNNNNNAKQSASANKSLIVRQLNSAVKNTAANNSGNQNPKTSNTAVSSRVKKIERTTTRTKNGGELVSQNSSAMISRNSRAGGIERETSTESLRLKMRRSESWDAKNKIYLNSSYLSASVAEKTTNRVVNNGIYNYDF